MFLYELDYRIGGALADAAGVNVHAAHARLRGEGNEVGLVGRHFASANVVFLFGQHHNGAALGGFVGQAGELRGIGQVGFGDAVQRDELHRLAVPERNRAGLIK